MKLFERSQESKYKFVLFKLTEIERQLSDIKFAISKLEEPALESKPYAGLKSMEVYKPKPKQDDGILLQQIKEMADDIRHMDQLIFDMSQRSSWQEMQPLFNKLMEGMNARKRNESNRIANIMRNELIKTYAPKLEDMTEAERKHLGIDK